MDTLCAKWPAEMHSIYGKPIKADLGERLIPFKKRGKTFLKPGKETRLTRIRAFSAVPEIE